LAEKIEAYDQNHQGKQGINRKGQKTKQVLESEEEDEVVQDDDEFQMPLHDGSGEQLNTDKKQKKVRYSG
jgi:hypothetical protein